MKIVLTLAMVHTPTQILLGLKKRGFAEGKWNGFGGKVAEGESIEEATRRELLEEAGLEVIEMKKYGVMRFIYEENDDEREVHVFGVPRWSGTPTESEEMRPAWFFHKDIPFDKMWANDRFWIPVFLKGKSFEGRFHFRNMKDIVSFDFREK